jgi:hypothetical protein
MTNTTIAAEIKRQHRGMQFLIISLCLHIVVLGGMWHFDFLGVTKLDTQKETEQPLRELAIKKLRKEEAQKQKQQLPEEHAEKLVKEEQKHASREMAEKVRILEEQNVELEEVRELKLQEIKEEPREALIQRLQEKTKRLQDRMVEINKKHDTPKIKDMRDQTVKMHANTNQLKPEPDKNDQALKEVAEEIPGLMDPEKNLNTIAAKEMLDQTPEPTQVTSQQELAEMTPDELYDRAKALEQKADQTFTDIKQAELSQQQNTLLPEAKQNLSHTPPARPEHGKELAKQKSELQTRADLNEFRKQLNVTAKEVDAMQVATADKVKQAQGMAKMSKAMGGKQNSPQQQFRARAMLNKFASGRQANVDMSQLMRQMSMGISTSTSMSDGMGDHRQTEGGTGTYSDPDDIAPTKIKGINIPASKVMAQALPGQKFSKDSARHGWLYLDTWYIIGPWENFGKLDHRDIFPPELSIDFDAEYLGKNQTSGPDKGKPMKLKWQFTQSGRIQVVPPDERSNAVYYAYTEVHFEQDTDMLLAVASDDSSKLWINDIVVWDDKTHSDWRIGEGSRKVFFKKGYNRLLLRLENRGSETEFSVLICPPTFK